MAPRVAIPGSEVNLQSGGSWIPADSNEQITATIILRRPTHAADLSHQLLSGTLPSMTREQAADYMRVDPNDLAAVRAFTQTYGLAVVTENAEARTIQVRGSVTQIGQAFGVAIAVQVDPEGRQYLSYQGALSVPENLAGVVEAVLGLDRRPVDRRRAKSV